MLGSVEQPFTCVGSCLLVDRVCPLRVLRIDLDYMYLSIPFHFVLGQLQYLLYDNGQLQM